MVHTPRQVRINGPGGTSVRTLTTVMTLVVCTMVSGCSLLKGGIPPAHTLSDPNVFAMLDTVNLHELEVADLAKHKASSEEVRMFATRMMHEHATMMQDLHQLAQRINIEPETPALIADTRREHMEMMQDLRKKSDQDFDHAYLTSQIMMHEQTIQFIDATADSANNFLLRQHLRKMHPALESHLSAVKVIQRHPVAQN